MAEREVGEKMNMYHGKCVFFDDSEVTKTEPPIVSTESISFDLQWAERNDYTISLARISGSLYRGKAVEKYTREEIPLTARVYRDEEAGLIFVSGTEWLEDGVNYRWYVEIAED